MVRELVVLTAFELCTLDVKAFGSRPHSSSSEDRRILLRAALVAANLDCTDVVRDVFLTFLLVECHMISVDAYLSEDNEA